MDIDIDLYFDISFPFPAFSIPPALSEFPSLSQSAPTCPKPARKARIITVPCLFLPCLGAGRRAASRAKSRAIEWHFWRKRAAARRNIPGRAAGSSSHRTGTPWGVGPFRPAHEVRRQLGIKCVGQTIRQGRLDEGCDFIRLEGKARCRFQNDHRLVIALRRVLLLTHQGLATELPLWRGPEARITCIGDGGH